jgi:5'-nucleotidase
MKSSILHFAVLLSLTAALTSCGRKEVTGAADRQAQQDGPTPATAQPVLAPTADEVVLTILATNDIHGGVEPFVNNKGERFGGLARISGIFKSIEQGLTARYPGQVGFLMLDGGDQFQGTLLSNYDEGKLTIDAMSAMGYDAVVPGNHDYDFGPLGWLQDKVIPGQGDQDPRGAFKRLVAGARFPFLSSSTFYKDSIRDSAGNPIAVDGDSCRPVNPSQVSTPATLPEIEWSLARAPEWVTPYIIREIQGVRVAVIGVDLHETPTVTTPQNVTDLCFAAQAEAYLRLRAQLEGKADVFVALMHDGSDSAKAFVQKIVDSGLPHRIDALVAGHTHRPESFRLPSGVPMIQSGANAERFGRLDLIYDRRAGRVVMEKTRLFGGVQVPLRGCPSATDATSKVVDFCTFDEASGETRYEGVVVTEDTAVAQLIAKARQDIAPVASG